MEEPRSRSLSRDLAYPLLLGIAAVVAALLAAEVADAAVGLMGLPRPHGLIFPANSVAAYHTTEFDYTASVNSLGFRDREFSTSKSTKCRVLAIGNSFTFGWGVSLEESWPKVLEARLGSAGLTVEVANLGRPGGTLADYVNIAARAIPTLKPDLVIVGVLQGHDLGSARSEPSVGARPTGKFRAAVEPIARALYPHLMAVFDQRRYQVRGLKSASINSVWAEQVRDILTRLDASERAKYARIDSTIRQAFESGNLNPSIIWRAVREPEYFIQTFELQRPHTQELIRQMSAHLSHIRADAASLKAAVIVVSIPFGIYVSSQQFDVWQSGLGFELDRGMLSSSSPDDAIRMAAADAGVPFFSFTQAFRASDGVPFFFKFDGHFNSSGHRLLAEQLTPVTAAALRALPTACLN